CSKRLAERGTFELVASPIGRGRDPVFTLGHLSPDRLVEQLLVSAGRDMNDAAVVSRHQIGGAMKSLLGTLAAFGAEGDRITGLETPALVATKTARQIRPTSREHDRNIDT